MAFPNGPQTSPIVIKKVSAYKYTALIKLSLGAIHLQLDRFLTRLSRSQNVVHSCAVAMLLPARTSSLARTYPSHLLRGRRASSAVMQSNKPSRHIRAKARAQHTGVSSTVREQQARVAFHCCTFVERSRRHHHHGESAVHGRGTGSIRDSTTVTQQKTWLFLCHSNSRATRINSDRVHRAFYIYLYTTIYIHRYIMCIQQLHSSKNLHTSCVYSLAIQTEVSCSHIAMSVNVNAIVEFERAEMRSREYISRKTVSGAQYIFVVAGKEFKMAKRF